MATIFYNESADPSHLKELELSVIGYGNQGRAQALNLRDEGMKVRVGARIEGKSWCDARADGFEPTPIQEAAQAADLILMTLPDEVMPRVFENEVSKWAKPETAYVFAHGFAIHNKTITLPREADVILVAPTGPGHQVRSLYLEGSGLPALLAVEQDASGKAKEIGLAFAGAIGSTRAGVIETTFEEETNVDLFCEQAVLCGGLPELIKSSFETLVSKGYQPELAYISCLKEVKLIADLLFDRGLSGMRSAISSTAKYGAYMSGPEIIDRKTRHNLEHILQRIENGSFAETFIQDCASTDNLMTRSESEEKNSRINRTGERLKENLTF